MGWMDDFMHVCNFDIGGLVVAKDHQRSVNERRQASAKEASSKLDALKYPNQKKVQGASNRKTRNKNGRPSGWRKVKIESVSQKREGGMDLDGEYPDDVPALNDDLHTSMANGTKPKQEVKQVVDKYQGVHDRKPIDSIEIEPSDSASEITLPEALNGVLTSFFGFNFKYDDVTQPELEHLEIDATLSTDDERMEKEDIQRLADGNDPSSRESSLKIAENDIPMQTQNESTMLPVDEPFSDTPQGDESKANHSTEPEKTTRINESMLINQVFPNEKTSLDGRSETREPDTPVHDQQAPFNTKHLDTDTRDDDGGGDDEIEKSIENHHEPKTKPIKRLLDKYQPLHQIVKDLSAKEKALQSKKEGVDRSSFPASTHLSNTTTSNQITIDTTCNETKYVPSIRAPTDHTVGVGAISQAYRRGRAVATTSNQMPNPILRLSLDVDEPKHQSSSHGSPSGADMSRHPAGRIKSEISSMTNDDESSGDAFPFVSSRATQIRPGSLRL